MSESGCHCCKHCERNTVAVIMIFTVGKNLVVGYTKESTEDMECGRVNILEI
jgi:hypothetical protein